jgi:hypothetical protein
MTIIVAKAENLCLCDSSGDITKNRPFVSARVFGSVQITKVRLGEKPKFNDKL